MSDPMSDLSNRFQGCPHRKGSAPWTGALGLVAVIGLVGLVSIGAILPARAQEAPPESPASAETSIEISEEVQALAREIGASFEVLLVRGGVVLQPKESEVAIDSIEIAAEGLAIDGEPVDEETVRELLGEAADPVLRLAEQPPEVWSRLPRLISGETPELEAPATVGEAEEPGEVEEPPKMRTGDKVSLIGGVTIERNEIAHDVVVVGGPLRVEGEIERDAVVVGGSAHIEGKIARDLLVVGGNVHLGSQSVVEGEINVMAGGRVHREDGAVVKGRINELGVVGPIFDSGDDVDYDFRPRFRPFRWFGGVVSELFFLATLMLFASLVILVGQRATEGIGETLTTDPWRSGAVGLAFQALFVPLLVIVVVLLAISIIGIPLLILVPFALLGLVVAAFVGYVGVALLLGRKLLVRTHRDTRSSPYLAVVAGMLALGLPAVFAEVFDLPFLGFLSVFLFVLWILISYLAATFGFGALLMRGIAGRRDRQAQRNQPPSFPGEV